MEERVIYKKEVQTRTEPGPERIFARIVFYLVDVVEILILVRFLFRLLAANPGNPFVAFIYNLTYPLVIPFATIFPASGAEGYVLEWASLIAMAVYALAGYLVVRLVYLLTRA